MCRPNILFITTDEQHLRTLSCLIYLYSSTIFEIAR